VSNLVGIDKVVLYLPVDQVKFNPDSQLIIENPIDAVTGEPKFQDNLYHDGERWRTGREAHLRNSDFQLSIEAGKGRTGPVALLQWSGAAFKNTNVHPLDREEVHRVACDVESALAEAQIGFNVDAAKLCRLDPARDHEMSQPVGTFMPVFQAIMTPKRLPKTDYGSTGLLAANGQHEKALYDKGEEMRIKRPKMDVYPVNTLRCEIRLKKSGVIRNSLGFNTLAGLQTAWDTLQPFYIDSLKRDIFRHKIEENAQASLDFYDLARFIRDTDSKRKWHETKDRGFPLVMVKQMGLQLAKYYVATELGFDPSTSAGQRQIKRMHLELDQAHHAVAMGEAAPDGTPLRALYSELKTKLLN
jgi:hypothetical protein